MNERCVVVFGGSGFIGTALCKQLSMLGVDRIISADLNPPRAQLPNLDFVRVDVRNTVDLGDVAPDIIFNLAAIHRTPGHEPDEYFDTNVLGALNVCRYADSRDVRKIVFSSSISVYGPSENLILESTPLSPNSSYGKSKMMAEIVHREWRNKSGGQLVIVRPAVVFGAGEGGNFDRLNRAILQHRFLFPGRRDTIKSCGYIDELISSMIWALQLEEMEILYNFSYPERCTIEQIARTIAIQNGVKIPRAMIPKSIMNILQTVSSVINPNFAARVRKLTESTNVYPGVLCDRHYHFKSNLASGVAAWISGQIEVKSNN